MTKYNVYKYTRDTDNSLGGYTTLLEVYLTAKEANEIIRQYKNDTTVDVYKEVYKSGGK